MTDDALFTVYGNDPYTLHGSDGRTCDVSMFDGLDWRYGDTIRDYSNTTIRRLEPTLIVHLTSASLTPALVQALTDLRGFFPPSVPIEINT